MTAEVAKLPKLADLLLEPEQAYKDEMLNLLLNQPVPEKWVKNHDYIKVKDENGKDVPYKYLPIDKVEHLLRKIFKEYRIEITGQGTSFNGVWVTVRVHYLNPVTNQWSFHDGIGAQQMQTKKGTSPADLANINNGAVAMAFPAAKSYAVKDACDHFGTLFGANLNRRDVLDFVPDQNLTPESNELTEEIRDAIAKATKEDLKGIYGTYKAQFGSNPEFMQLLNNRKQELA